jgi:hypothetical protein
VAGNCECGNEPSGSIKLGEFLDCYKPVSFSRSTLLHGVSKFICECVSFDAISLIMVVV